MKIQLKELPAGGVGGTEGSGSYRWACRWVRLQVGRLCDGGDAAMTLLASYILLRKSRRML